MGVYQKEALFTNAQNCLRVFAPLGDSLAVELPPLERATLVRIQVPQPFFPVVEA